MDRTADPLDALFALERFGIKPGLETIGTLVEALDRPDAAYRSVIVAGTNGKGSVVAMVDSALRAAGYRVGRYTSPHLISIRERLVIDGEPIQDTALRHEAGRLLERIDALIDRGDLESPPTFFETVTALALSWFRHSGVEIALLEVGLGGRFDATNIVTPIAGVITAIGLDHREYLGDTLAEVATEKAGIIKPGMVVVTTETDPAATTVFERVCADRGARLVHASTEVDVEVEPPGSGRIRVTTPERRYPPFRLPLVGRHQHHNAAGAVRLLECLELLGIPVSPEAIVTGLAGVRWPGRLDTRRLGQVEILLDAAHNPPAAEALASHLRQVYPRGLPIVLGVMSDKDVEGIAGHLAAIATRFVCTAPSTARAIPPATLAARVRQVAPDRPVDAVPDPREAVRAANGDSGPVCVTGSIFLVGEILASVEQSPDEPIPHEANDQRSPPT